MYEHIPVYRDTTTRNRYVDSEGLAALRLYATRFIEGRVQYCNPAMHPVFEASVQHVNPTVPPESEPARQA
jgi:hypothetical protein